MPEVNIFIDIYFQGQLKHGTGTYCIVLEYIKNGTPYTKKYIEGLTNTTSNRTAIKACITALQHLTKQCQVTIIINSKFVYNAVNQEWYKAWLKSDTNKKGEPAKNLDLWKRLSEKLSEYWVGIKYEPTNKYSTEMYMEFKKAKINYEEDKLNV